MNEKLSLKSAASEWPTKPLLERLLETPDKIDKKATGTAEALRNTGEHLADMLHRGEQETPKDSKDF